MEAKELTAHDYKLKKWSEIIAAKQNSGMKVSEFCESTGVSRNSYYYWQRKVRDKALKRLVKTESIFSPTNTWIELNPLKNCRLTIKSQAKT